MNAREPPPASVLEVEHLHDRHAALDQQRPVRGQHGVAPPGGDVLERGRCRADHPGPQRRPARRPRLGRPGHARRRRRGRPLGAPHSCAQPVRTSTASPGHRQGGRAAAASSSVGVIGWPAADGRAEGAATSSRTPRVTTGPSAWIPAREPCRRVWASRAWTPPCRRPSWTTWASASTWVPRGAEDHQLVGGRAAVTRTGRRAAASGRRSQGGSASDGMAVVQRLGRGRRPRPGRRRPRRAVEPSSVLRLAPEELRRRPHHRRVDEAPVGHGVAAAPLGVQLPDQARGDARRARPPSAEGRVHHRHLGRGWTTERPKKPAARAASGRARSPSRSPTSVKTDCTGAGSPAARRRIRRATARAAKPASPRERPGRGRRAGRSRRERSGDPAVCAGDLVGRLHAQRATRQQHSCACRRRRRAAGRGATSSGPSTLGRRTVAAPAGGERARGRCAAGGAGALTRTCCAPAPGCSASSARRRPARPACGPRVRRPRGRPRRRPAPPARALAISSGRCPGT